MGELTTRIKKLVLFLAVGLTACDPGLSGDLKVYNNTNQVLTAKYLNYNTNDTTVKDIQPNSSETIKVLSGLGNKKTFDCCPCQLQTITIKSPLGTIKKDPANSGNWTIPNKRKLRKFGGQDIKCEFHVEQSDL